MRLFLESFRLEWGRNFYPESHNATWIFKAKKQNYWQRRWFERFWSSEYFNNNCNLVSGTFPSWWIIFLAPLLQAAANACRADRVDHLQVSPGFRFTCWISHNHWSNTVDGSLSHDLRGFNAHPTGGWEWDFWTIKQYFQEFPGKPTSFSRRPNLSSKPRVKEIEDAWMETFRPIEPGVVFKQTSWSKTQLTWRCNLTTWSTSRRRNYNHALVHASVYVIKNHAFIIPSAAGFCPSRFG